jgi:hypothetical protein
VVKVEFRAEKIKQPVLRKLARRGLSMACPFFVPTEKLENGLWLHPHRLPLGCGWSGRCGAPGHEGEIPSSNELRDSCNLGYSESCSRLPLERAWDSIRFSARIVPCEEGGQRIQLRYVCERAHRPAGHGSLEFDATASNWLSRHHDARLQRLAQCFLETYLDKSARKSEAAVLAS